MNFSSNHLPFWTILLHNKFYVVMWILDEPPPLLSSLWLTPVLRIDPSILHRFLIWPILFWTILLFNRVYVVMWIFVEPPPLSRGLWMTTALCIGPSILHQFSWDSLPFLTILLYNKVYVVMWTFVESPPTFTWFMDDPSSAHWSINSTSMSYPS